MELTFDLIENTPVVLFNINHKNQMAGLTAVKIAKPNRTEIMSTFSLEEDQIYQNQTALQNFTFTLSPKTRP